MVDRLHPGGEQGVELGEIRDAPVFDLDQELLADRGENPLDLPPAGRLTRLTVDQADPEHPAGSSQPPGDKNVPVVDVKALWYTSGGKAGPQRRFEAQGVLGMAPAVAGKKPGGESSRGAVPPFQAVRLPDPLTEPGVRLSPHRALHKFMPLGHRFVLGSVQGEGMVAPR